MDPVKTGKIIYLLRKEKGLTQKQLAETALKSSKNLTHQLKNTLNLSKENIHERKTQTKLTIQSLQDMIMPTSLTWTAAH